jgi:hypothetical protein
MNLENIKEKLELEGYTAFISQNTLIGGEINGRDEQLEFDLLGNTFSLEIKNHKIIVDYSLAQTPKEKEFTNLEEAINFIKEARPL